MNSDVLQGIFKQREGLFPHVKVDQSAQYEDYSTHIAVDD